LVADVRWERTVDERTAAWREGDFIYALRPPFNACRDDRPPNFVSVISQSGGTVRLALEPEPSRGTRAYGCFPHLGKGVASAIGVACSDGYTAFLRLLWAAAGEGDHVPAGLSRSAPMSFITAIDGAHARAVRDLFAGTSGRVIDDLAGAAARRPAYMQPALARDRDAAMAFFASGPRWLRDLRRRHGIDPGRVSGQCYRELIVDEMRAVLRADA
jgi:hypothetical protein